MDKYVELLILAYFQNHSKDYFLSELRELIGVSYVQLEEMLEEMIDQEKLFYEDLKLRISFKGRIELLNSRMEEYQTMSEGEIQKVLLNDPWPVDKPFYVSKFSKNKWRGV